MKQFWSVIFSAFLLLGATHSANALVLPDAISYAYIGINYADNIVTSNSVGTLNYDGHPGCGGTCNVTTQLGASPSVSATVNEVYFDIYQTSGGGLVGRLGYYVEYLNAAGTYSVNLHATDSFSAPSSPASAALTFGLAGSSTTSFNNFASIQLQEADCMNGCPAPGFVTGTPAFTPDHQVQMIANTLYFVQLDVLLDAQPTGVQNSVMIDPVFTSNSGGEFVFSPGVFGVTSGVPEPSTWAMMILGFCGLGFIAYRRRQPALAA